MPSVIVEDLPKNCQVTIVVTELIDMEDDPNPPSRDARGCGARNHQARGQVG